MDVFDWYIIEEWKVAPLKKYVNKEGGLEFIGTGAEYQNLLTGGGAPVALEESNARFEVISLSLGPTTR